MTTKYIIATVNLISGQWDVLPDTFNSVQECADYWKVYENKEGFVPVYKIIKV